MVKICQTGLLKLNFEIAPKKRIFRFLPKISAGHGWSWKNFFANFQTLGPLGCQGWVVIPQNVKKSQNHCTLLYMLRECSQAACPKMSFRRVQSTRDHWFWQNFIISMCGINFWKAYENLRYVSIKKPFYKILRDFLHFDLLSSQKVFIVPSKRWTLFFFKYCEWDINNFKNENLILLKNAPKISFSQKLFCQLKNPRKFVFLGKTFFGKTFFWRTFN